jgi:hypothetical protein
MYLKTFTQVIVLVKEMKLGSWLNSKYDLCHLAFPCPVE